MNSQSQIADSRASREAALLLLRLNYAATLECIERWPDRATLVARAMKERDRLAAAIAELEGQCQP